MKHIALLFALLAGSCYADALGDEVAALNLRSLPGFSLSSNELRDVVTLAHEAGMKRVERASVGVFGAGKFLSVQSPEFVNGRRIVQHYLSVNRDGWYPTNNGDWKPIRTAQRGSFWLESPGVRSFHWAMFTIQGKPQRLTCWPETDLAEAEKVLAALAARQIEYANEVARQRAQGMPFDQVKSIFVERGRIDVGLKHSDSLCDHALMGRFDGRKLIIETAMSPCM